MEHGIVSSITDLRLVQAEVVQGSGPDAWVNVRGEVQKATINEHYHLCPGIGELCH